MRNMFKYYEIMEMIKDTCQEDFSRQLEVYLRKEVILSFISKEKDILDVGCGWAILSIYLAKHGHNVTAIDNSQTEISIAQGMVTRYRASVALKLAAAQRLDFPDRAFDLVIWEEVLEHLEEPLLALKEGFRVLRPEGKIILSVPNSRSLRARIFQFFGLKSLLSCAEHKQNFNQDSLSKLVKQAGFKIICLTSDFIPIPKLPITFLLDIRKKCSRRHPSLGHHLFVYAQK